MNGSMVAWYLWPRSLLEKPELSTYLKLLVIPELSTPGGSVSLNFCPWEVDRSDRSLNTPKSNKSCCCFSLPTFYRLLHWSLTHCCLKSTTKWQAKWLMRTSLPVRRRSWQAMSQNWDLQGERSFEKGEMTGDCATVAWSRSFMMMCACQNAEQEVKHMKLKEHGSYWFGKVSSQ